MNRRLFSILAPLAVIAASTSCADAAKPKVARPALWKVADADTTIYLFGTIHLLPKSLVWTSPKIVAAMKASRGLVLETVLDRDPQKTGAIMVRLGRSPGLPPLLDRVPAANRAALQRVIDKAGVPLAVLNGFETWAAALTLASVALRELPVSPDYGAEKVLTRRFAAAGKPVRGLETPEQQLGYFDTLSETAQRQFLVTIAEDDSNARAEFDTMIDAWSTGDVGQIAVTFDDELKLSPELTEALLRRRNANWVGWIERRMASPGTLFVAVGAGHLAGPDSVAAMLVKNGATVTRLQ